MAQLAAPAVSFVGMIRFRFEGSSSRSRRNLSPPRRTPLQATRTKALAGGEASETCTNTIYGRCQKIVLVLILFLVLEFSKPRTRKEKENENDYFQPFRRIRASA
jgi:hypothetical protein